MAEGGCLWVPMGRMVEQTLNGVEEAGGGRTLRPATRPNQPAPGHGGPTNHSLVTVAGPGRSTTQATPIRKFPGEAKERGSVCPNSPSLSDGGRSSTTRETEAKASKSWVQSPPSPDPPGAGAEGHASDPPSREDFVFTCGQRAQLWSPCRASSCCLPRDHHPRMEVTLFSGGRPGLRLSEGTPWPHCPPASPDTRTSPGSPHAFSLRGTLSVPAGI